MAFESFNFQGVKREQTAWNVASPIIIRAYPNTSEPKSSGLSFQQFMLLTGVSLKMVWRPRWPYKCTKCQVNPLDLGMPHFQTNPCILEGLVPWQCLQDCLFVAVVGFCVCEYMLSCSWVYPQFSSVKKRYGKPMKNHHECRSSLCGSLLVETMGNGWVSIATLV